MSQHKQTLWIMGVVAIFCFLASASTARTILVGSGNQYDFQTLRTAIADANRGDTILVADGIYQGSGNRNLSVDIQNITLKSINGPEICIIDCQGTKEGKHRGFCFQNCEGTDSVLEGVTITNGYELYGGGIYCLNSGPTIKGCVVKHNSCWHNGSGIYCKWSMAIITDCILENNTTFFAAIWHN